MYTNLHSTERSTFDNIPSLPHAPNHRDGRSPTAARPVIEALQEEDEDQFNSTAASSSRSNLDVEQRLSASLMAESSRAFLAPRSPRSDPAPSSQSTSLSASPAAMFLSAFTSPAPAAAPKPDDEGQIVGGYTLGPIIGYGASSIIRRASSQSGGIAAVKIVRRSDLVKAGNAPQARKKLQHEATVWATLSHEHILPLFSVVHSPYADYFFTLYCPAGSLFDILKRDGTPALLQDDAGMMFRQVVRGLRYLHEVARYVHRDMKLENVLVDDMGMCKIGDFGMTRKMDLTPDEDSDESDELFDFGTEFSLGNGHGSVHRAVSLAAPSKKQAKGNLHLQAVHRHNTVRHRNSTSTSQPVHSFQPGSLPYAAPELLLPQTSDAMRPHPGQDIWALGVMLYALLTGRLPFSDSFEPRLQMKILNGTYEIPQDIGRGAERILQGCLDRAVSSRWTIAMVDEVAWGVGWGAEGDDATSMHEEPDPVQYQLPASTAESRSCSRSRSRPASIRIPSDDDINDWQHEEPRSRPSMDAASRRSSSRVKRSLSRAPVLTDRSSSARSVSRSVSRHPRGASPSDHPDQLTAEAMMVPFSSSTSSYFGFDAEESALVISPVSSASESAPSAGLGRGRRPTKPHHSASRSRSPSPSVVPTTPLDGPIVVGPSTSMGGLEQPDELHLDAVAESSRGRSTMRTLASPDKTHMRTVPGHEHDQEEDEWAAEDVHVHADRDRFSGVDPASPTKDAKVGLGLGWRHRPSSSPPTGTRAHFNLPGHRRGNGTQGGQQTSRPPSVEFLVNPSLVRSRSAEHMRRGV